MIVIAAAMKAELTACIDSLEEKKEHAWNHLTYFTGIFHDEEAVVWLSGVGKVSTALSLQRCFDMFSPEICFFTGIAGSINKDLEVGDIVLAEKTIQWDLDTRFFKMKRGKIPFTKYRILKPDPELLRYAESWEPANGRLVKGTILTGDTFIAEGDSPEYSFLQKELKGDAVEMEGASANYTAELNSVPFLLFRILSDQAKGINLLGFKNFVKNESKKACMLISHILTQRALSDTRTRENI